MAIAPSSRRTEDGDCFVDSAYGNSGRRSAFTPNNGLPPRDDRLERCSLDGATIAATHSAHPDMSVAQRPACAGLVRQDTSISDDGGDNMAPMNGTIKRLVSEKGFGFIAAGDGNEYFFHQSACNQTPFDSLSEGQAVTFERGQGPKGPRGENVRPAQ